MPPSSSQLSQLKERVQRVQSTTNDNILERLNAINYPLEIGGWLERKLETTGNHLLTCLDSSEVDFLIRLYLEENYEINKEHPLTILVDLDYQTITNIYASKEKLEDKLNVGDVVTLAPSCGKETRRIFDMEERNFDPWVEGFVIKKLDESDATCLVSSLQSNNAFWMKQRRCRKMHVVGKDPEDGGEEE
jgi:hypothetical protein